MAYAHSGHLTRDAFATALEAILGFMLGTVGGTLLGLLLSMNSRVYGVARVYLVILGSTPLLALGPLFVFWLGTGILAKTALGFLLTIVVATAQSHQGAMAVDRQLLALTRAFGASRWFTLREIVAPAALVWVVAGIRLNIGLALLGAVTGEFIGSSRGLGHMIIVAEGLYNVNQIWVGVAGLAIIGLSLNALVTPLERVATRWK